MSGETRIRAQLLALLYEHERSIREYETHAPGFRAQTEREMKETRERLIDFVERELAATRREWQPIETAPYGTWVLAWLHLPKNPIASAPVIAQRCHVERDDPESYSANIRQTVGCWWANGMYYPAGHVTHWMSLPAAPTP